jgi:hypothetical protein
MPGVHNGHIGAGGPQCVGDRRTDEAGAAGEQDTRHASTVGAVAVGRRRPARDVSVS